MIVVAPASVALSICCSSFASLSADARFAVFALARRAGAVDLAEVFFAVFAVFAAPPDRAGAFARVGLRERLRVARFRLAIVVLRSLLMPRCEPPLHRGLASPTGRLRLARRCRCGGNLPELE